jgi:hypothetical protein
MLLSQEFDQWAHLSAVSEKKKINCIYNETYEWIHKIRSHLINNLQDLLEERMLRWVQLL